MKLKWMKKENTKSNNKYSQTHIPIGYVLCDDAVRWEYIFMFTLDLCVYEKGEMHRK